MSPFLSPVLIYIISFFYTCAEEVTDVFTNFSDTNKVVRVVPENEQLEPAVKSLNTSNPNKQFGGSEYDSQIRILNWKLQKNLETLVFLRELERHYDNSNNISGVVDQYYDLKKEVQNNTIEITNQLSYYKSMTAKSA